MSTRAFLSCDWGTSSFRIRWVENDRVVREHRDDTGCRVIFERAGPLRAAAYAEFLSGVLQQWPVPPDPLPLVISGMASSTIGWKEVPYAEAPLRLDGSNLGFEIISWERPDWVGTTYLISGVATEEEMMRGEETEAIGLLNDLPSLERCVLILPGTHSKHLLIEARQVTSLTTYMTGELFDVLARHSVLQATVDLASLNQPNLPAFDAGVHRARKAGLERSLFTARTRAVLKGASPSENTWFLSGLLIGAELADVSADVPLLLGGAPELRSLYARALAHVPSLQPLPDEQVAGAVAKAHALFLELRGE